MPTATLLVENAGDPSVSRTGDVIVYRTLDGNIARTNKERTETVTLWEVPGAPPVDSAFNPVVSNDGTLVIFEFQNGVTSENDLYSMSATDGSDLTQITDYNDAVDISMVASFSPDDSQIVFSRQHSVDFRTDLFTMDVDGNNLTELHSFGGTINATTPNWSVDDTIIFVRTDDVDYSIWTINPNGTGEAELATDLVLTGTEITRPVYSPDGTKIVLLQSVDGSTRVIQMDSDGQNSVTMYDNTEEVVQLNFTDGEGIQYFPNSVEFVTTGQSEGPHLYTWSPDRNAITFAVFNNTDFIDWEQEDAIGFDFSSYFISGYKLRGEGIRKFQTNWLKVFYKLGDEVEFDFSGRWDYTTADTLGRFTQVQRIIQQQDAEDQTYETRRLKVRGRGDVLQIKILSVAGHPFDITGWSCVDTVNEKP